MAFNIQEFKSRMDRYGGPARTNLFMVELAAPNDSNVPMPSRDLRFFCKTATIPSITIETTDYKPNNIGLSQSMPTGISNDAVECVFMLDSNHQVLSFFHEWMQNIVNYDTSNGLFSPNARDADQLPYEINYKKGANGYSMRMIIKMFSVHDSSLIYECVLENAYPKTVGSLSLSWEENDTPATLPVSFSYSEMKMSGTRPSNNALASPRGVGGVDFFTSVGETVQTISTNLQTSVNRFTTVANNAISPFTRFF